MKTRILFSLKVFGVYISIIILSIINSCKESPTAPSEQVNGITGQIYGSDGKVLSGAKIYCLFYLYDVPIDNISHSILQKHTNVQDYQFELFQNFPNPFSNSFFLRFSLPEECVVELSIISKKTGITIYHQTNTLQYGFFQLYFKKIVDSLSLSNGLYHCRFKARGVSGKKYFDEKTLFVVSNSGASNAISDSSGKYIFDERDAFIGDTVSVMYNEQLAYTQILDRFLQLLIIKDGYVPQHISLELLPRTLLRHDIVLRQIP